ncbi:short-chain dehydrogenase [Halobacteriales archaeon QH_7_65_31]|nr:MAG: short-chain dehydrogenase [Halobacteriales archaeon QH_7_65_31]PSQ30158.1 MAG: short-chain dehydrogenase [Halobacteriales archaeon SW_6_65_46]
MRVLVTGGSRGVGRATAVELAAEHDVAVGYVDNETAAAETVTACREQGATAVAVGGDLRDSAAADRLVAEAVDELGGLDALVSNAGIVRPNRLGETTDEAWRDVLGVNLDGAFYATRAAMPQLRENDGAVVYLSSIGGTAGTVDAAYAASKAGLHGLTRALARELGPDDVQVNAVAPGPVETSMNETIVEYLEAQSFRGHENVDTHLPAYACEPVTVAESVRFLLETEYVHGEILRLDGGMSLG